MASRRLLPLVLALSACSLSTFGVSAGTPSSTGESLTSSTTGGPTTTSSATTSSATTSSATTGGAPTGSATTGGTTTGGATTGGATTTSTSDVPPDPSRIFVTKDKYNAGMFEGVEGADQKCATIATAKGFDGIYRAWVSNETTDAISRIQGNGPWQRLDGMLVFKDKEALKGVPLNPVLFDENGTSVAGNSNVWTGTMIGGVRSALLCQNWLSNDGTERATVGYANRDDAGWTDVGQGGEPCNDFVRLLCLRAD